MIACIMILRKENQQRIGDVLKGGKVVVMALLTTLNVQDMSQRMLMDSGLKIEAISYMRSVTRKLRPLKIILVVLTMLALAQFLSLLT